MCMRCSQHAQIRSMLVDSEPDPSMYGALPPGAWWEVANGQQVVRQPYADMAGDAAVEVSLQALIIYTYTLFTYYTYYLFIILIIYTYTLRSNQHPSLGAVWHAFFVPSTPKCTSAFSTFLFTSSLVRLPAKDPWSCVACSSRTQYARMQPCSMI